MWVRLYILLSLSWVARGAPSTYNVCADYCKCYPLEGKQLEAHCSTQEFLDKVGPKQIAQIVSLSLRAQAIRHVDNKLKKLYNLKKLDLSDNNIDDLKSFPILPKLKDLNLKGNAIQRLTAAELPKTIEYLDASFNNISYITDLSDVLPNLKELDLNNNVVVCDCEFLTERDALLRNGVNIVRPVSCHHPPSVKGKSLLSVYCAGGNAMYDELMPGDEPDIGSGEIDALPAFDDVVDGSSEGNLEEDYIITNNLPSSSRIAAVAEGSGGEDIKSARSKISVEDEYEDYGSGDAEMTSEPAETTVADLTESDVHACFFNCSTPSPDNLDDGNTGPQPDVINELTEILKDLTGFTEATTIAPASTTEEEVTEQMVKEIAPVISATNNRAKAVQGTSTGDAERKEVKDGAPSSTDSPKELEKQSQGPKQSNTTFIIVAVLLVLMAALIVYAVVKRRSNRQNNNNRRPNMINEEEKNSAVEMKALIPTRPTTTDSNNLPERKPLINGQNGTHGNKEVEEPEVLHENRELSENKRDLQEPEVKILKDETDLSPADDLDEDDVLIRPKLDDENLLEPETKRVTIQVKELSSPKTPVFVHRHLSDDGRIITTPSLEQRN